MARNGQHLDSSRMGEMHEGKLLFSMAVPMMLSMLVQALYNVVDSIYVAQVSENCLSALSLAFPAQNIMIGLGTGTGVGVATLISRALGRKDGEAAGKVAGTAVFLGICCWAVMAMFGIFFGQAFIYSQTQDESIRAYALVYLRIVTIGSFCLYQEIMVERFLQSTGQTRFSMWTQMVGAVTNIILDPFFIFGWLGLPAMGTAGAALATVLGQCAAAFAGFTFHRKRNPELVFTLKDIRPRGEIIKNVYKIGLPSILMMGINSLTNYLLNRILMGFTSTAVAVLGAYFKLQSFFFMPVFGLNNAMIPIVGYNYGARKKERIHRTFRYAVLFAMCVLVTGFLIFQIFPDLLLGMFNASDQMLEIGRYALRRISISFIFAGFCIITISLNQALGHSVTAFIVSILRQVVALIPAAFLLASTGNVNNVWFCYPIAEFITVISCFFFLRRAMRILDQQMAEPLPSQELEDV